MLTKSANDKGLIQKKNKKTGKLDWYARIVRIDGNGKKKEYTAKAENKSAARGLRNGLAEKFNIRGEQTLEGSKLNFRQASEIFKTKKLYPAEYHGEGAACRKVGGVRSINS